MQDKFSVQSLFQLVTVIRNSSWVVTRTRDGGKHLLTLSLKWARRERDCLWFKRFSSRYFNSFSLHLFTPPWLTHSPGYIIKSRKNRKTSRFMLVITLKFQNFLFFGILVTKYGEPGTKQTKPLQTVQKQRNLCSLTSSFPYFNR